jgi:hypothetical protein
LAVLIVAVACDVNEVVNNGWTKGPDGYKYFTPEVKMELPQNDYLPPVEGRSNDAPSADPIEAIVEDAAPIIDAASLEPEITTIPADTQTK